MTRASLFFISLFLLAEIPVLPLGDLLGTYAVALNLTAIVALALCLALPLRKKEELKNMIVLRRLGLSDEADHIDQYVGSEWHWFMIDYVLLWLAMIMALGSVFYNLAVVSKVYNPFIGEVGLISVFFYFVDQAVKGALFGLLEILGISTEPSLVVHLQNHWFFAGVVAAFRMAVAFTFVQVVLLTAEYWRQAVDPSLRETVAAALRRK
jgi:hypothetical protein